MTNQQINTYLKRRAYRNRKSGATARAARRVRALVRKYDLAR